MELALNEMKLQAKRLLKHIKNEELLEPKIERILSKHGTIKTSDIQLKHCLQVVSRHFGFDCWHHCQSILSGNNTELTKSFGTLFYHDRCGAFINQWFATYTEAKEIFDEQHSNRYLLPYKTQFIVVQREFISSLFNKPESFEKLKAAEHNLYSSYNSKDWDYLAFFAIKQNPLLRNNRTPQLK